MKILITGGKGMLGTDITHFFSKDGQHEVFSLGEDDLDITNYEMVKKVCEEMGPEIIVNCAAYTNVDDAEENTGKCHLVNVIGVQHLVDVCKSRSIVLVQISTDYVFDGTQEEYVESDVKSPINFYGRTKADAEKYIVEHLEKWYIVRTSWLFGSHGKNFVKTIHTLCSDRKEIQIVEDQVGSPTYTCDLAEHIGMLLAKPYGVYHVTNSGFCSWYTFATEITHRLGLSCEVNSCLSSEYPQKACRPKRSILRNTKTKELRSWKDALQAYIEK